MNLSLRALGQEPMSSICSTIGFLQVTYHLKVRIIMASIIDFLLNSPYSDLVLHKADLDNVDLDAVPDVLASHTNHESSWAAIQQWLQRCQNRHIDCNEVRSLHSWLPTRLLDTGLDDSNFVRVVDTHHLAPESVAYVALSHCWGKKHFLVMNEGNRKTFQTYPGVPVSALAPNFQDAILTTRKLGFRYVWIDSLCILQGSRTDWQQEAPLMNKVYLNAVLTLAPAASSDAFGGFFRSRDPTLVLPYKLQMMVEGEKNEAVTQQIFYAVPKHFWKFQVSESALNQRAWVLQERVLSRCTVYFGEDQVFWECRELAASSTFMDGLPGRLLGNDIVGPKKFISDVRKRLNAGPRGADWYGPWKELLRVYTSCDITNPNDKLVAISGMAKEMAMILNDDYVAGLWRKNLVDDLLWYTIGVPGRYATRPKSYRAPSWSWASIDAPVLFADDLDLADYVENLQVDVEAVDIDLTMEIKSAIISLYGYPVETLLTRDDEGIGLIWYFDTTERTIQGRYVCLPLRKDGMGRLWGLILRATDSPTGGIFTREGVFSIDTGYRIDAPIDEIHQVGSMPESPVDGEDEWEWFDKSTGKVKLSII